MIISPDRNFIFLHIPKCGGSSIECSYEDISIWSDLILGSSEFGELINPYYKNRFRLYKHANVNDIAVAIGTECYREFEKISLVRNPFRVYESLYSYIARVFKNNARNKNITLELYRKNIMAGNIHSEFEKWDVAIAYAESKDFCHFIEYFVTKNTSPIRPFHCFLELDNPSLKVDSIFKLEEIDNLWKYLDYLAGQSLVRLHLNRSDRTSYQWSQDHLKFIENYHLRDLNEFGYDFKS